jgi:hypothetical protein
MMHDDDRIMPGYIERVVELMNSDASLACVATNALIINEKQQVSERKFHDTTVDLRIGSVLELLECYFGSIPYSVMPFPAYCYRLSAIQGLAMATLAAGKYSDVLFLCSVVERGAMLWIREPLYVYRFHSSNDSCRVDFSALRSLLAILSDSYAAGDLRAPFLRALHYQASLRYFLIYSLRSFLRPFARPFKKGFCCIRAYFGSS